MTKNTGYRMVRKSKNLAGHIKITDNSVLEKKTSLYKYMKSKHAHSVLTDGTFRIGTLQEFQNEERHGTEIGDREEGTKHIRNSPSEIYDYSVPESVPSFAKKFIRAEEGQHVKIIGIPMEETITSPNYYLYCLTSEICREAMDDFKYDTIIKINDPKSFFRALTESLSKQVQIEKTYNVARCKYIARINHYSDTDRTHPAIIKEHKYSYQKEVRAIWTPINGTIEPFLIQSKIAAKFCSIVNQI